jgi:acyl-CoA dehydrogenase
MDNESRQLILDTVERVLQDHCDKDLVDQAEQGVWPLKLWQNLEQTGLTLASIDEAAGGGGGETIDGLNVIRTAARFAAPLPLAETFIASHLLRNADIAIPAGPLTVTSAEFLVQPAGEPAGEQIQVTGTAKDVPFGRWSDNLVVVADDHVLLVPLDQATITPSANIAGEPRDQIDIETTIDSARYGQLADARQTYMALGCMTRVAMMSGALSSILELSVQYAMERDQFGRPIAKFQAIQQQLAQMAGEVAASQRAADALFENRVDPMSLGIAKARVGESVGIATEIAHQVHGAMGYTREHPLNLRTRRLWCWRDEFGNENHWQQVIANEILAEGADNLWQMITSQD